MRYAKIKKNDTVDGEGICVSYWAQGCSLRCDGCHNASIWDFDGGIEEPIDKVKERIGDALVANGVKRNFSVLGGEPLALQNIKNTREIIWFVRNNFPNTKVFLWTGYTIEQLSGAEEFEDIKKCVNVIIDGPYKKELRDITLHLRGSSNQRILKKGVDF